MPSVKGRWNSTREPSQGHRATPPVSVTSAQLSWTNPALCPLRDECCGHQCWARPGESRRMQLWCWQRRAAGVKGAEMLPWGAAAWGRAPWRCLGSVWCSLEAGAACLCAWAWRINPPSFQHCSECAWFWMHLQTETSRQALKHRDWQTPETSLPPAGLLGFLKLLVCTGAFAGQVSHPESWHHSQGYQLIPGKNIWSLLPRFTALKSQPFAVATTALSSPNPWQSYFERVGGIQGY